jgi:signal transduction histidine kinase
MKKSVLKQDLEKLYNVIADEAILAFLAFDKKTGHCLYINKLARDLFQLPEETPEHHLHLTSLFVSESIDSARAFTRDLLEHEGLYQDIVIHRFSGHKMIANIGFREIRYANFDICLLMIQDITIQKKLQREVTAKQIEINSAFEELVYQNKKLKELDLAKNRFIALTTHELRTPLSAMIASAEVLKLGLYDNDKEKNEFIDIIYDQGLHLVALVNDILDFAKIQAGKMDYYVTQGPPKVIIHDILESLKPMAEAAKIQLIYDDKIDRLCYFDDLRLKQVLTNIVNNAIKYNRDHGWVRVWCEDYDSFIKICVQDSGLGIALEDQEKVFDEFETLGKVALHHKGTGLGMPISKRLIEGMGGSIHLESTPGQGSKFWVQVPKEKILDESAYRERPDTGSDLAA